jgi:hypothetical protein
MIRILGEPGCDTVMAEGERFDFEKVWTVTRTLVEIFHRLLPAEDGPPGSWRLSGDTQRLYLGAESLDLIKERFVRLASDHETIDTPCYIRLGAYKIILRPLGADQLYLQEDGTITLVDGSPAEKLDPTPKVEVMRNVKGLTHFLLEGDDPLAMKLRAALLIADCRKAGLKTPTFALGNIAVWSFTARDFGRGDGAIRVALSR